MSFDTEKLIREIECRKALWDISSEEYSDRDLKKRRWEEITNIFCDENLSENGKKDLGKSLQQKWKNVRTSFRRELKRLAGTKSGSAAARKSPYVYFNQLQFLKNMVEINNTQGSMGETAGDSENEDNTPRPKGRSRSPIKKKKTQTEEEDRGSLLKILKQSVTMREERENMLESDSDRSFLLSLLPDFKKIPEYKRLSTKLELMRVIQKNIQFPMPANHSIIRNNNEQYAEGYTMHSNYTMDNGQYRLNQEYSTPRTNYRQDYLRSAPGTSHSEHIVRGYSTSSQDMEETTPETIREMFSPTDTTVSDLSHDSELIDLY